MTGQETTQAHSAPWLLCRCEEVPIEAVERAIAAGARTVNDVKRQTRAGMGLCQGVYCAAEIAALLVARTGQPPEDVLPMTARPPVRPLALALLARLASMEDQGE